jgi:hypothetical protein
VDRPAGRRRRQRRRRAAVLLRQQQQTTPPPWRSSSAVRTRSFGSATRDPPTGWGPSSQPLKTSLGGGTTLLFAHKARQNKNEFMSGCSTNSVPYELAEIWAPKAAASAPTQPARHTAGTDPQATHARRERSKRRNGHYRAPHKRGAPDTPPYPAGLVSARAPARLGSLTPRPTRRASASRHDHRARAKPACSQVPSAPPPSSRTRQPAVSRSRDPTPVRPQRLTVDARRFQLGHLTLLGQDLTLLDRLRIQESLPQGVAYER